MQSKSFSQKVIDVVFKIPRGKTLTYKEVAKLAGSPRAYRAVGNILNKNYKLFHSGSLPLKSYTLPCHRVIRSDGTNGGFAGGSKLKNKLLKNESKQKVI